jgi:predicted DCC family thiol-disulfide oxidoreductase YuxK
MAGNLTTALILFDGRCALCSGAVRFVLKHDKRLRFYCAPLGGPTAAALLGSRPIPEETFVLVENFKTTEPRISYYGKAALRVLWLLGGPWQLIGLLAFLPGWIINPPYRFIAHHRPRSAEPLPFDREWGNRFLP